MTDAGEVVAFFGTDSMDARIWVTEDEVNFTSGARISWGAGTLKSIHQVLTGPTIETWLGVTLINIILRQRSMTQGYVDF